MSNRYDRANRIIESIAMDLVRLPSLKGRIKEIEVTGHCKHCLSLTYAFLKKQVKEIEDRLNKQSSRMLRLGRQRAEELKAPIKT